MRGMCPQCVSPQTPNKGGPAGQVAPINQAGGGDVKTTLGEPVQDAVAAAPLTEGDDNEGKEEGNIDMSLDALDQVYDIPEDLNAIFEKLKLWATMYKPKATKFDQMWATCWASSPSRAASLDTRGPRLLWRPVHKYGHPSDQQLDQVLSRDRRDAK